MSTAGYNLQCYSPSAYDVGGWYNYSFWCKGTAANTSYTSARAYVRFAYWNGSTYILDTDPVAMSLEGMGYNGYGKVSGYNQGQTVSMRAYFFSNYNSAVAKGSTGSGANNPDFEPYADATITLPTVTVNYTVTYSANGADSGSPNPTSQTVASGANTILGTVGTATKTGYHATGWAESADGAYSRDFESSYTVTGNKTFYLYWEVNSYTVNYNGNGNTGGSTASSSHTYGTSKALTSNGFTKTGYAFKGWATSAGGSVVYTNGQSVLNLTTENGGTVELYAVWEDDTEKASYIIEHVTNKAYRLTDSNAIHGSGTADRVARFTGTKDVANNWLISASTPPSTVTNGDIYVLNNATYPSDTSWVMGTGRNWGETVYCCIKVSFVSETLTTYTVKVQTNSYVTGFDGGIDAQYASWYVKQGSTYLLNTSGTGYTWSADWGGNGYLASGNFYDSNVTINKSSSTQTITFEAGIGATGYTTATVTRSITVPASGMKVCVGATDSWKAAQPKVYNGSSWVDATMYVYDGSTWVKGNYTT